MHATTPAQSGETLKLPIVFKTEEIVTSYLGSSHLLPWSGYGFFFKF